MPWIVLYPPTGERWFKRPPLHANQDVQLQSAANEQRDGFVARFIRDDPTNPKAFQLYYRQQWAEDVQSQSAANEPRNGWQPTELPNQYRPRFALYYQQQWAEDVQSQSAAGEPRDGWVPRALRQPYSPKPWLLEWGEDLSQSATAPSADVPLSWAPRLVYVAYRARPTLYWAPATDAVSAPVAASRTISTHWMRRLELLNVMSRG